MGKAFGAMKSYRLSIAVFMLAIVGMLGMAESAFAAETSNAHGAEAAFAVDANRGTAVYVQAELEADPNHDVGWVQEGGAWYYYVSKGKLAKGWKSISDNWYWFDSNGAMATGWISDGGTWYYLRSSGAMATGWVQYGGTWYYLRSSGAMATGWISYGGAWYYLQPSGAMAIGWQKDGNDWYYLKSSGAMATGWVQYGGTWYYLRSSGAMATGWISYGGAWYYLKPSGAMATGWQKVGNDWYYLESSGAMATGWVWGGKWYWFDSSGKWVSDGQTSDGTDTPLYASIGEKDQAGDTTKKDMASLSSTVRNSFSGISMAGAKAVGIDVSQWQADINWQKVANSGIDFAIIRCGWGSDYTFQDDWFFLRNVQGAKAAGLDLGVYLYGHANTTSGAIDEANHTLRLLKAAGLKSSDLKYGVYYDFEDPDDQSWLSAGQSASVCNAYCNKIRAAGYSAGIYSSLSWWNTKLYDSSLNKWNRWVAQWPYKTGGRTCSYTGKYVVWQCMSDGSVPGISGRVDMDLAY